MLSIWILMLLVVMVCVIALAMVICAQGISATQFAVYMSVANPGHSAGSKIFGIVADRSTCVDTYMLLGIFVVAMVFALFFNRDRAATEEYGLRIKGTVTIIPLTKIHAPRLKSGSTTPRRQLMADGGGSSGLEFTDSTDRCKLLC